jgi:2-polyprenyl-3-methyl-5-hydroxy-6-metoxy-1,4-benzoquinol methylase
LGCVCGAADLALRHVYTKRPAGETEYPFTRERPYRRELYRCEACGHFVSGHEAPADGMYAGDYVSATYGADGIRRAFDRIIALEPGRSDNAGRVQRIGELARAHFGPEGARRRLTVLDVGSGLGVFPYAMKAAGWDCTALDPDERAARHAQEVVGVRAICADFDQASGLGRFDLVTFNKVLEHVDDPVAMLAHAAAFVADGGLIYVEVPDGPAAFADDPDREEFFLEHRHVFSVASLALTADRAGFAPVLVERLREPSGKYTLRAFLVPFPT